MTKEPTEQDLDKFVRANVHYCVSALVSTLAESYAPLSAMGDLAASRHGDGAANAANARDLCEQAFELAAPIPDYESAAEEAGWESFYDKFQVLSWRHKDDGATWAGSAQDLCDAEGINPYDRDVYEHWIVDDWLADRLEEHGEKVDKDFAGLTVWARTTTGQSISMDSVVKAIWRELHNGG